VAEFQPHYDLVLFAANTVSAYAQWGEVKNLVKGVGGMDLIIRFVVVSSHYPFQLCQRNGQDSRTRYIKYFFYGLSIMIHDTLSEMHKSGHKC
jgi:hypothetical protein